LIALPRHHPRTGADTDLNKRQEERKDVVGLNWNFNCDCGAIGHLVVTGSQVPEETEAREKVRKPTI
jgi:hypothetical protein